eukprot:Gb_36152 [translate_table: standard]
MKKTGFRNSSFRRLDKKLELVRHLVSEKAIDLSRILNCKTKEGRTAIHMAVLGKVIHENLVELVLLAPGLDINPLLKQLGSAGGRPMHSRDLTANNINISHVKNQGLDNNPDKSPRRLSACPNVDCHDHASCKNNTIKYYIGNQKQLGSVNQAKQRLATLFGWSHGQSNFWKQDKKMAKGKQDTETRSKTSAEEEAFAQIMHTKEWLHHRRSAENQSPLRQRFSKTKMSGNKSHSFGRKTPPSPSTKRRLTALNAQNIDQSIDSLMLKDTYSQEWKSLVGLHLMIILSAVGSYMGVLSFQYRFLRVLLALLQKILKMFWM